MSGLRHNIVYRDFDVTSIIDILKQSVGKTVTVYTPYHDGFTGILLSVNGEVARLVSHGEFFQGCNHGCTNYCKAEMITKKKDNYIVDIPVKWIIAFIHKTS